MTSSSADHGQRGKITLRRNDGRSLEAHYDARQTEVGGLPYYVCNFARRVESLRLH